MSEVTDTKVMEIRRRSANESESESSFVSDKLNPLEQGYCSIKGYLGNKLDACINNGIMAADYSLYVTPFRDKTDDKGQWGGEFFGKWYTSAAHAYSYRPEASHLEIIQDSIEKLKQTQDDNGRLSASGKDFSTWDIWGRKYSLLALLSHFEQTADISSLQAAADSVRNIIGIAGRNQVKITETGLEAIQALSSCSILEPVAKLYRYTGDKEFLEFAEYIVELWSEPSKYASGGIRLIEDAIAGISPVYISAPKAYEMMSCYEGLCELYRATGDSIYFEAVLNFAKMVKNKEIMIVGSGSSSELWCDGAVRQTEHIENPIETCVTATWMKLCYQLIRITGDSYWADELELTSYNALLAAMVPDGSWWAYYTPLAGCRVRSHVQISYVKSSCCVVSGPRGLMTIPQWAVMSKESGVVVNLYNKGTYSCGSNSGGAVLEVDTEYPADGRVKIRVSTQNTQRFELSLRIPAWSKNTKLSYNGKEIATIPGTYAVIDEMFADGDEIILDLDFRGRVITSPGSINHRSVMCGPVVLAFDDRLVKKDYDRLWINDGEFRTRHDKGWNIDYYLLNQASGLNEVRYIDLVKIQPADDGFMVQYDVPFISRPTHFFNHKNIDVRMCDFASAGSLFDKNNVFSVWLPQPSSMSNIFPTDTEKNNTHSLKD